MAKLTMKRVYVVFDGETYLGHAATKDEAAKLKAEVEKNRAAMVHEDEPKECPDKSGRIAPRGQHWVRNIMSNVWVLEACGTPYTMSVQSETYWSM